MAKKSAEKTNPALDGVGDLVTFLFGTGHVTRKIVENRD